ncbi:MAG TPA: DUF1232 domain-containing protein [Candidatus Eisenbacteria bacterium]|nr:DUF1232 domain-containing protein [Candidatus Eisenbacteria bacterium]
MKTSHLLSLLKEASLSPEDLARRLDVSNMTLRRLLARRGDPVLPELYARELRRAVYELVGEGKLDPDSPAARRILLSDDFPQTQAAIKGLGFPDDFLKGGAPADEEGLATGLSRIGCDGGRAACVDKSMKRISSFSRFGGQWAERIRILTRHVRSRQVGARDKFVAYGSLFYLLYPLDLLPDFMPALGYLDDFARLGIAVGVLKKTLK